jgi:DNA-binding response OmpR family regulator
MNAVAPSRACIVVAEDDGPMRAVVAESLRHDGHIVRELSDGARLLVHIARQYQKHDPTHAIDLIVSDLRMPVVSGLAMLRGLRAAHWETPVILMTAFGDEDVRAQVAELHAVLLDKPFSMAALRAKVNELLAAHRN